MIHSVPSFQLKNSLTEKSYADFESRNSTYVRGLECPCYWQFDQFGLYFISYESNVSHVDWWYTVTVVDRSALIWSEPNFCSLGGKPL